MQIVKLVSLGTVEEETVSNESVENMQPLYILLQLSAAQSKRTVKFYFAQSPMFHFYL